MRFSLMDLTHLHETEQCPGERVGSCGFVILVLTLSINPAQGLWRQDEITLQWLAQYLACVSICAVLSHV